MLPCCWKFQGWCKKGLSISAEIFIPNARCIQVQQTIEVRPFGKVFRFPFFQLTDGSWKFYMFRCNLCVCWDSLSLPLPLPETQRRHEVNEKTLSLLCLIFSATDAKLFFKNLYSGGFSKTILAQTQTELSAWNFYCKCITPWFTIPEIFAAWLWPGAKKQIDCKRSACSTVTERFDAVQCL